MTTKCNKCWNQNIRTEWIDSNCKPKEPLIEHRSSRPKAAMMIELEFLRFDHIFRRHVPSPSFSLRSTGPDQSKQTTTWLLHLYVEGHRATWKKKLWNLPEIPNKFLSRFSMVAAFEDPFALLEGLHNPKFHISIFHIPFCFILLIFLTLSHTSVLGWWPTNF